MIAAIHAWLVHSWHELAIVTVVAGVLWYVLDHGMGAGRWR